MKLTNTLRSAFIRAAMADVPKVDYQEKTIKVVMEDAVAKLPPKVKAVYKDKELTHFIQIHREWFGIAYVEFPGTEDFNLSAEALAKVKEFEALDSAQDERVGDLRAKLHAVAYSCTTRKALLDALPEFEKYLPADESAAARNLPAVANLVSDFVQAGWPKGAKKAAKG